MNGALDPRLGEMVYHDRFGAGLDFWAVPRPGWRQKAALLRVDYGSVDLGVSPLAADRVVWTPSGTAHFLEHRLFEKSYGDIADRFSSLGAEVNASTSFTATIFTMTCVENFTANLELLFELVFDLQLAPGDIEREREIIDRELRLGSDDPEWVGFLRGLKALYGDVPLSWDMAGSAESLQQIKADALTLCHDVYYRPQNMGLYICGDFDLISTCASIETNLAKYNRTSPGWEKVERAVQKPLPQASGAMVLPINRPYVLYFYGDERAGMRGRELLSRELALELALDIAFGPASDFFAEYYGLIAGDAFGAEVYAEPTFCFCAIGGYTQHGERLGAEVAATLTRLDSLIELDFDRAKRKAYGQLLRSYEQVDQMADLLCSAAISGAEPGDYFDIYDRISLAQVRAALEDCLRPSLMGSVQIVPNDSTS
ncbi:MAG: pitrilysin family protein [Candidatus Latescibacterota bacterium]|nr:pitrilysin family protein [Candidatus Latescibacterota bacterium]